MSTVPDAGRDHALIEATRSPEAAVGRGALVSRFGGASPGLAVACLVVAVVAMWSIAPYLFTGYSGTLGQAGAQLRPPSAAHWFGTDQLGRDLFARIVYGSVNSLAGAAVAVAVGLVAGTAIGLMAGMGGGLGEAILMRGVDVLLSIPALLLSLSVIILLGFGSVHVAIAVGVVTVASFARLARSEVVRVRRSDYVEAAFGSGASRLAVLWRHVLPNAMTPILAYGALQFGRALLQISTLGFLGYGAPPPTPEWGLLIAEGRNYIATAWWLTTFPGLAIVLLVLAVNRIARAVRRTDP